MTLAFGEILKAYWEKKISEEKKKVKEEQLLNYLQKQETSLKEISQNFENINTSIRNLEREFSIINTRILKIAKNNQIIKYEKSEETFSKIDV